jgi:hypothetical protein
MALRTVTSEIAIVPESEFRAPTLMVGPDVSTHDCAFAASFSVALLPQPASNKPVAATTLPTVRADRFNEEGWGRRIDSLSVVLQARIAAMSVERLQKFSHPAGVESGR